MEKQIIARKPEGKEFENVPAGNHIARCFSMIQMGTHKGEYMGKENLKEKVRITWELPLELREDGKPFVIGQEYTLTLASKGNLLPMLESWRGQKFTAEELDAFNIVNVLGAPCMLNVVHNEGNDGKTYANVQTVAKFPKGMECPAQINEKVIITVDDFKDEEVINKLPEFIQKKIKESLEYNEPMSLEQEHKASIQEPIIGDVDPDSLPY